MGTSESDEIHFEDQPNTAATDAEKTEEAKTSEEEKPPAPDWLIDNIAELSRNARSIYLIYLGFLAYCAITIVGTTDRQILLDESVRLPLVGVDVSFTGFFVIAPLVAIGTFVYLQLYLQRLKRLKNTLRTEYEPVETGRLYPWMLNVVDDPNPGFVGWLQRAVVKMVLWWMLPVVLFLFAIWYLKAQDPVWGWVVIGMPVIGSMTVLYFWEQYENRTNLSRQLTRVNRNRLFLIAGSLLLQSVIIFIFVQITILGDIPIAQGEQADTDSEWGGLSSLDDQNTVWLPAFALNIVKVDVSYQSLIAEQKYARYWADLSNKRLYGANLAASTLINADLRDARLEGTDLQDAQLDSANLQRAYLNGANLDGAQLHKAQLDSADFHKTKLRQANLRGAQLEKAQFDSTNLRFAHLEEANLQSSQFDNATLEYTHLEGANLRDAHLDKTLILGAHLEGADLRKSHLQVFTDGDTRLDSANLRRAELEGVLLGAHLEGADLRSADLKETDLSLAHLEGTNLAHASIAEVVDDTISVTQLQGARLTNSNLEGINCTSDAIPISSRCTRDPEMITAVVNALCESRSLKGATLDSAIREGLEKQCPSVLKSSSP